MPTKPAVINVEAIATAAQEYDILRAQAKKLKGRTEELHKFLFAGLDLLVNTGKAGIKAGRFQVLREERRSTSFNQERVLSVLDGLAEQAKDGDTANRILSCVKSVPQLDEAELQKAIEAGFISAEAIAPCVEIKTIYSLQVKGVEADASDS